MNSKKRIKVVLTGTDVIKDFHFNIVKIGNYDITPDDCVKALQDGIFDKYKRAAPEFEIVSFNKGATTISDTQEQTICTFMFKEFGASRQEITTIAGKATFVKLL